MKFDPEARRAARPAIAYDEALPVNVRRAEIAAAIQKHQVVVICGETGSGKTTQLPKICLELGRGLKGLIGHTQPRRIAARATASRIAQELKSELGRYVGYKIRFTDKTTPESYIKLMTDGILLAETQTDPLLRQYDTILIDEAHERSLNIDFLLGYLKSVLARRRDLKLIVTSATLDAERFSKHFDGAPIIEVSGRLYPIETRYRPFDERKDADLNDAIVDAVSEAHREGPGDVLVFLPGEREIREAAEALRKHHPPGLEVLPLFARQTAQEQSARVCAAPGPARGAGDQRCRDFADGAGHPLRRRFRAGARQALLASQQGRAVAGGGHRARGGQPASRALRARLVGHLFPPLRRGRLQQTRALHRSGNPALLARRCDPAHEVAAPWRRRGFSLPRSAAAAHDRRWLHPARRTRRHRRDEQGAYRRRSRTGKTAARPEDRPHDPRRARARLPEGDAGHRRRARHAGPARPAAGTRGGGRPGACEVEGREVRISLLSQAVACRRRGVEARVVEQAAPVVPGELHQLAAAARMARRAWAVDDALPRARLEGKPAARELRQPSTRRC